METLTDALKAAIRVSKQTIHAIAQGAGVEDASLRRFMAGKRSMRLDMADKVASYLSLSLQPSNRLGLTSFVDLFSGIGGFHAGLAGYGMRCLLACEIDPGCRAMYRLNYPGVPIHNDVRTLHDVPPHDVLTAGFPCQSFSISGSRGGLGDDRGILFREVVRIASKHRPKVVLMENVKHLLQIDGGRAMETIRKEFDAIGYSFQHALLNLADFGVPQARWRVYMVAIAGGALSWTPPIPDPEATPTLRDFLSGRNTDGVKPVAGVTLRPDHRRPVRGPARVGHVNKAGQGDRIYSGMGHAITITSGGGGTGQSTGLYYLDGQVRALSVAECVRLMGFEDGHHVGPGKKPAYRQLGNAVAPTMVRRVFAGLSIK